MAILYNTPLVVDTDDRSIGYVDDNGVTRYIQPLRLCAIVALADAAATLTAAQIYDSGVFTITPTAARTLTTDTAAAIIAAMPTNAANGNYSNISIIVLGAFAVTLAAGVGVTIVGAAAATSATASFRVRKDSASAVTIFRV